MKRRNLIMTLIPVQSSPKRVESRFNKSTIIISTLSITKMLLEGRFIIR